MTREVNRLKPLANTLGPGQVAPGQAGSTQPTTGSSVNGAPSNSLPSNGGVREDGTPPTGDAKVVTALIDNENHRHVYVYFRRKAQQTLRHIRQQFDAGRLSLDAAKRLHRQVAQDCGMAG